MYTIKYINPLLKYEGQDRYLELTARVSPANKDCDVSAIYTFDEWRTTRTKNGTFVKDQDGVSLFRVAIKILDPYVQKIWFAVKMVELQSNAEVYDNNFGWNYEVRMDKIQVICYPASKDSSNGQLIAPPLPEMTSSLSPKTVPVDLHSNGYIGKNGPAPPQTQPSTPNGKFQPVSPYPSGFSQTFPQPVVAPVPQMQPFVQPVPASTQPNGYAPFNLLPSFHTISPQPFPAPYTQQQQQLQPQPQQQQPFQVPQSQPQQLPPAQYSYPQQSQQLRQFSNFPAAGAFSPFASKPQSPQLTVHIQSIQQTVQNVQQNLHANYVSAASARKLSPQTITISGTSHHHDGFSGNKGQSVSGSIDQMNRNAILSHPYLYNPKQVSQCV